MRKKHCKCRETRNTMKSAYLVQDHKKKNWRLDMFVCHIIDNSPVLRKDIWCSKSRKSTGRIIASNIFDYGESSFIGFEPQDARALTTIIWTHDTNTAELYHVDIMLTSCWVHVGFMLVSYWVHVGFMLILCWFYVAFMLLSCWVHVGFMFVSCWVYVGFMLVSCCFHVGFMLALCWVHVGFMLVSSRFHVGFKRL